MDTRDIIVRIKELEEKRRALTEEYVDLNTFEWETMDIDKTPRGITNCFSGGAYGDLYRNHMGYDKWKNSPFVKNRKKLAIDYSSYFPVRYKDVFLKGCMPPSGSLQMPHLPIDVYGLCDAAIVNNKKVKLHIFDPYDEMFLECHVDDVEGNPYELIGKMVAFTAIINTEGRYSIDVMNVAPMDDMEIAG